MSNPGIDYGRGVTNIDVKTGIRMENLDALDRDSLWGIWALRRFARKADRLALFGQTGRRTIKACKAIANYACNKAVAMDCRGRGDIQTALQYESICDRIYKTLPDFARW